MLVVEGAKRLSTGDVSTFKLSELIAEVQRSDSTRARGTIQPIVQGMTANAGKGPASPCGKVFIRVDHGHYKFHDSEVVYPSIVSPSVQSSSPGRHSRTLGHAEVRRRIDTLVADFDLCVEFYDCSIPFTRSGQYEFHRRTIDRRIAIGSVEVAIHDEQFTELLYQTLQHWGIGRRASRIVPLMEFRRTVADHAAQLIALELLTIEKVTESDVKSVSTSIDELISDLSIVENRARIVAGTKTLHHILPNLVPPMDRAWTGAFFGWSTLDPQNSQARILGEAFEAFADIARRTNPSRLIGAGWRTSSTKVLDNAVIGYCKLQGIGGTPT